MIQNIKSLIEANNKLYHLIFILAVTIGFPFIIHMIPPVNGTPTGAILLPMFYISIPAIYLFKDYKLVALGVGLAPIVNHIFTGRPDISLMTILTFELVVYTVMVNWLLKRESKWIKMNVGGLGYVLTKVISSLVLFLPFKMLNMESGSFFLGSLSRAIPGIIILCIISQICYYKFNSDD